MGKFTKKQVYITTLICFVGFIIPFFTRNGDEEFNTTISTSFSVVSAIISIITLIVAIILFDRFGVNSKFKEKQVDLVLTLVNELSTIGMTISTHKYTYLKLYQKMSKYGIKT